MDVRRVLRALWQALRLTLRGQAYTPPVVTSPLLDWAGTSVQLVTDLLQRAEASGLDQAARQAHTLTLDKRTISMHTILAAVQYNATREYPALLRSGLKDAPLTIRAVNVNDVYRVTRLAESLAAQPELASLMQALADHLKAVPPHKT